MSATPMETDTPEAESASKRPQEELMEMMDAETVMNLALSDPPRWGWTAAGGMADLLSPHERSRRKVTAQSYRKRKRKRGTSPKLPPKTEIPSSVATPTDSSVVSESTQSQSQSQPTLPSQGNAINPTVVVGNPELTQTNPSNGIVPPTQQRTEAVSVLEQLSLKPPLAVPQRNNNSHAARSKSLDSKLLGVKAELVGMSVQKVQASEESSSGNTNDKSTGPGKSKQHPVYECHVLGHQAIPNPTESGEGDTREATMVSEKRVVDMYSYHRGREGFEPRDSDTGELLCPLEGSDTNWENDAPKMVVPVDVKFPLDDQGTMFKERMQWDLSDSTTPSPMVFAMDIATEFGLEYGQMLHLAKYVQRQIEAHVQEHFAYSPAIATKDPLTNERRDAGPRVWTYRFGQVIPIVPGGFRLTRKEQQQAAAVAAPTPTKQKKDKLDMDEPIDSMYKEEVQRRGKLESQHEIAKASTNGNLGLLERHENIICHICHKRCDVVFKFSCSSLSHSYCAFHCKTRLGETFDEANPICSFCPICSLSCQCSRCSKKLDVVSREIKRAMELQGCALEATNYESILERSRRPMFANTPRNQTENGEDDDHPNTPKSTKTKRTSVSPKEVKNTLMVRRPLLRDFPREVFASVELEPGTPQDFLNVYTWRGIFPSKEYPSEWKPEAQESPRSREIVEDCHVDYCVTCKNPGNLVCCAICPRAFHVDCINGGNAGLLREKWDCPVCRKESRGLAFSLDPTESLKIIQPTVNSVGTEDPARTNALQVLGLVHAMLGALVQYDFGYVFEAPVDVDSIPGYKETIEHPMDLGTISEKLQSGQYLEGVKEGGSWDDALISVLKDIELVWHNCFLFNFKGSAIYKMAEVQRKRAQQIQRKYFDSLLSLPVKETMKAYIKALRKKRQDSGPPKVPNGNDDPQLQELRLRRPCGKHKVMAKTFNAGTQRPVAVFDPVTGRIVKAYSSMRSAGKAALLMINIGHRSEWPVTQDIVRQCISRGTTDPTVTLFGYRWLMLDDLNTEKVEIRKPLYEGLLLNLDGKQFVFSSVEEALSFAQIPRTVSLGELRKQLEELEARAGLTSISGLYWRRVISADSNGDKAMKEPTEETDKPKEETVENTTEPKLSVKCPDTCPVATRILEQCCFVKLDQFSGRRLMGFDTFQAAFEDWKDTVRVSPIVTAIAEDNQDRVFREEFLDSQKSVDGIVWLKQSPMTKLSSRVEEVEVIGEDKQDKQDEQLSSTAAATVPAPVAEPVQPDNNMKVKDLEVTAIMSPDASTNDVPIQPDVPIPTVQENTTQPAGDTTEDQQVKTASTVDPIISQVTMVESFSVNVLGNSIPGSGGSNSDAPPVASS
eukprot:Nitzschia sp. Nitz4//scaffold70_size99833//92652//96899//NITZ4_004611-RA/size99833-snap-gene-0.136-mRNA-1//1//CDS//3329557185//6925//frame0